ncbi:MAG: DUF3365 domain-containing protein, partial [Cyanobacteria bacterium J06632_3]
MLTGMHRLNQLKVRTFEQEVHNRTALVSEVGRATRSYVANQLKPAIEAETDALVVEGMSSFYATRGLFDQFNKALPEYRYREPTLNPLNPANQADTFEADLIRQFQADHKLPELSGYRQKNGGEQFYVAKPSTVKASCLKCHGNPDDAPEAIVERYGKSQGYGWQPGDILSASVIYVPTDDLRASQAALYRTIVTIFFLVVLALVGTIYLLFEGLINRRIVRIGK